MVCRITLNLRTTVYGPTTFERTLNSIPMGDLRQPRSGRSHYTLDSISTKNLQVHIQTDYDRSQDHESTIVFDGGDISVDQSSQRGKRGLGVGARGVPV